MSKSLKPSQVLKELAEMRKTYKDQGFSYNQEQQEQYDKLRQLRYERVSYFMKNGIVSKGGLRKKDEPTKEDS
tara:strand:- start:19 stop:237 length:219 start_codon:yes stop_codon:yes gene_type:complete